MKKIILFLTIIALLLAGCDAGYSGTSAGASDYDYALSVIQASVPYIGGMDLRLDSIKLLETDAYGRNLFVYEMGLSSISALLIIQKTDEKFVYYYEDLCYLIQNTDAQDFSGNDKDLIKNNNSWNQPLDESLMTSINYAAAPADYENIDNYFETCKLVQEGLAQRYPEKRWGDVNIALNGLESYDGYGQIILAQIYYSDRNSTEYYLVLYNPSHENTIREAEAVDGILNFNEQVKVFKDTYCRSNK